LATTDSLPDTADFTHADEQLVQRRHLKAIVANQTAEIEKGGEGVTKQYRLRGLAWRALGDREKAEADFQKAKELQTKKSDRDYSYALDAGRPVGLI